jgi:hypothetical protein
VSNVTSEEQAQEEILTYLAEQIAQPVVEQSIPNSQTVLRNAAGDIDPYVAIQFGDLQLGRTQTFAGPVGADYILPVYTQAVASTPRIARRVANRVRMAMIGANFSWTGSVAKRPGGGMFPIVSSNAATEAYQFPASFGVLIQYAHLDT